MTEKQKKHCHKKRSINFRYAASDRIKQINNPDMSKNDTKIQRKKITAHKNLILLEIVSNRLPTNDSQCLPVQPVECFLFSFR